jgi:hypothetical protein
MKISKELRKAAKAKRKQLMAKDGVVAIGVGAKIKGDSKTRRAAVVCFVKKKKPMAELLAKDAIPSTIVDKGVAYPTDVIEVGEIRALAGEVNRQKHRPVMPGISVGHYQITAGTLGVIVEKGGDAYILSNNHVLADTNAASVGDAIYQPAAADMGSDKDKVAELAEFVPIDFATTAENTVDCALAKLYVAPVVEPPVEEPPVVEPPVVKPPKKKLSFWGKIIEFFRKLFGGRSKASAESVVIIIGGDGTTGGVDKPLETVEWTNEVLGIGAITGQVAEVAVGDAVQKSGRTTGVTQGEVIAIDVTVDVNYGPQGNARFVDQILTTDMSQGGDSGSAIFDSNKNLVGLLFAGSDTVTIMNPIQTVFAKMGIERIK